MTPDDEADATLAGHAAGGDEPAFGQLMRRHKEPLFRLLRRLTGDPEEAYDLLQETFVAAWRGLGRYDPDRPFAGWVRQIALNKARDWTRRRRVRRWVAAIVPGRDDATGQLVDTRPSPEAAVAELQGLRRLDLAIAGLPAALKEPLVLTAFDGLSQATAAGLLGISEKAVETRVRRARSRLKAVLNEQTGGWPEISG